MKFIKLYEELYSKKWKVSLELPYMEIGLEKIGMDEEEQEDWKHFLIDARENKRNNGIGYAYIKQMDNGRFINTFYEEEELKYMDAKYQSINISKEDIEDWKMRQDANKYNL